MSLSFVALVQKLTTTSCAAPLNMAMHDMQGVPPGTHPGALHRPMAAPGLLPPVQVLIPCSHAAGVALSCCVMAELPLLLQPHNRGRNRAQHHRGLPGAV